MGLFYSSPSKPNFFRIGRGPLPMRPQKIPGKAAPTWSLKMLNRIRVFPQNLALGMKTHKLSAFNCLRKFGGRALYPQP